MWGHRWLRLLHHLARATPAHLCSHAALPCCPLGRSYTHPAILSESSCPQDPPSAVQVPQDGVCRCVCRKSPHALDVCVPVLSLERAWGRAWQLAYFLKDSFLLCFLLTLHTKPQFLGGLPWVWVLGPGAGPCQEAPGPTVTPSSQDIRSDSTQSCSGASRSPESLQCPGRGRCMTSGICGCRRTHRGGGLPQALGDGGPGGSEIRGTHRHSPG